MKVVAALRNAKVPYTTQFKFKPNTAPRQYKVSFGACFIERCRERDIRRRPLTLLWYSTTSINEIFLVEACAVQTFKKTAVRLFEPFHGNKTAALSAILQQCAGAFDHLALIESELYFPL